MKGYYLFAPMEPENLGPHSGVERKVRAQHKSLNEYVDCELVIMPAAEYSGSISEKIIRRLPFTAAWRKWEYKGEFDDADFLYMRQVYHDDSFARYLRSIKKSNPKIKIIYELPTYPFDDVNHKKLTVSQKIFAQKSMHAKKDIAKCIDRIVTFYGQNEIWGVSCIDLMNGYDFSKVQLPKREKSDAVHIMSVSATAFWHGYDRVIEGIHEYYENGGTENIVYHLVGNILPEHQKAVENYGLQEHVIFYGRMSGEPLKEVFEKNFMGIDVLGGHRKQYPVSSSLKSREYAAYGMPVITSSPIDYLPEDYEYQFIAPYDDSPLDMKAVLEFYHGIYDNNDCYGIAKEIREYAVSRCDMSIAMKPVADWILEKEENT